MYYLRQVCRTHGRAEFYVSFIRHFLLHYHFNKRALAGSVIADERYALAAGNIKLKPGILLACINSMGKIKIPGGRDRLSAGDTVVVVTTAGRDILDLNDIFAKE